MSVDQEPLFNADVTYRRIDPSTQVDRMPGCDAICECVQDECLWPWCPMPPREEDDERR